MLLHQRPTHAQEPPTICLPKPRHAIIHQNPVSIAPLCDADLTAIFSKRDVKAYDQAGATILEGWRDPSGANDCHFSIVDSDYNSDEDSLFPSDDKLTIIPPPNPPPEPLPPPATPVPDIYWNRIKHENRPAGMVQLTYWEQLDQGLVTPTEQNKRQHREMACSSNLNTTSSYPCIPPHALPPPTLSPQARGSGGKNVIFSNGPNSTSECSKLLY
jgi:hypothetical protein